MQVPDACQVEKYQPIKKRFLTNFWKNWKDHHFTVNGHRSFKLLGKVTFLWQLLKTGTFLLKLVL